MKKSNSEDLDSLCNLNLHDERKFIKDVQDLNSNGVSSQIENESNFKFIKISKVALLEETQGKSYNLFALDIQTDSITPTTWTVWRRYQQFKKLFLSLNSYLSNIPLLPHKNHNMISDIEYLEKSKLELQSWLLRIQNIFSIDKSSSTYFYEFFTIDANMDPDNLRVLLPYSPSNSFKKSSSVVSIEDFELIEFIGRGSFATVDLVKKKDEEKFYAMKTLSKSKMTKKRHVNNVKTEIDILENISHPFIVKLHFSFQTDTKIHLVLDYADGGDLYNHLQRIKKFSESEIKFYASEIILAIEELHREGIVYRDLKPENILFDKEGHILLTDFGLAKQNITEPAIGAFSLCGTPEYLSPEVLNRSGHGLAVDWWSLGMVCFEMCTGLPPWYSKNTSKIFDGIKNGELEFPSELSDEAKSLITSLLARNPADRLGFNGAQEIKNHIFFKKIEWDAVLKKEVIPPLQYLTISMSKSNRTETY